jgi:ketosteroid isomerase-like protein
MTPDEWIQAYADAWLQCDAESAAQLFTDDAEYYEHLMQTPARGHEGIERYWRDATEAQSEIDVRMGTPFVDGSRVAVEFWTTMNLNGDDVTAAGCLLLRFAPDGRCEELREYWYSESGRQAPPAIWGR